MKKIIIFGATGQVGVYVTDYAKEYFAKRGRYEVVASGRRKDDLSGVFGLPYVPVDVTRAEDFSALPQRDVHAVVMMAAQLPIRAGGQDGYNQLNTNVFGMYNVLEYCRRVGADRLLFTQTNYDMKDYFDSAEPIQAGWKPSFSYTDDHAMYVIAKNTAIEMMEHYYQKYGLKKFVFRLPNIYAYNSNPYIWKNGSLVKRPLYVMIDRAIAGQPLEIWGDPGYRKDMVYVKDLAQMMCRCIEANLERGLFNGSSGMPVTQEQQVRTIAKVFCPPDKPSDIVYCPEKPDGGGQIYDVTEARELLGYRPEYDCEKLFLDIRAEMAQKRFAAILGLPAAQQSGGEA